MNRKLQDKDWFEFDEKRGGDYLIRSHAKDSPIWKRIIWVLKCLQEHDVRTILDTGCGPGWHTVYLIEQGYDVVATDYSEVVIRNAHKRHKRDCFYVQDIMKMTDDKQYDAVLCLSTLVQVKNPRKALERLVKAAKKVVYVTFELFNSDQLHYHNFTAQNINKLLKPYTVGNTQLDITPHGDYFYVEILK